MRGQEFTFTVSHFKQTLAALRAAVEHEERTPVSALRAPAPLGLRRSEPRQFEPVMPDKPSIRDRYEQLNPSALVPGRGWSEAALTIVAARLAIAFLGR